MTTSPTGEPPGAVSAPSLVDETVRALSGYYGRLGRIGLDLARTLVAVDGLHLPTGGLRLDATPLIDAFRKAARGGAPADSTPDAASGRAASPTLLVEGDGDRPGFGVFLVENLTAEPVSAPITVSAFVDAEGREVRPRLLLRPATVSLDPGQQAMVQLTAELDEALEPGVRYRGEIAIPALSDRRIPIVLRRVATPTADAAAASADVASVSADDATAVTADEAAASPGPVAAATNATETRPAGRPARAAKARRTTGAAPVAPAVEPGPSQAPARRRRASPKATPPS
jgi:hypothetical protein